MQTSRRRCFSEQSGGDIIGLTRRDESHRSTVARSVYRAALLVIACWCWGAENAGVENDGVECVRWWDVELRVNVQEYEK